MKRRYPLMMMALFGLLAIWTSVQNYRMAQREIRNELTQALLMTQAEGPEDWLSRDTIQQFRSHIPTAELRDVAALSFYVGDDGIGTMGLCSRGLRISPSVCARAYLSYSALQVWRFSDQRLSALLALLTMLCMAWSLRRLPCRQNLRLTPMQEQLVSLLMSAPGRTMSKQDICQTLWPGKPDASETLYTLVRRTKQALETEGHIRITSERGRSYRIETA